MRSAFLVVAVVLGAAAARADGPGVVAAEVGCGYVGGVAAAAGGVIVGNLIRSDEFASGGYTGFLIAYPAGVGLGTWGAGEIWGDDSAYDWATAAAAVGASYLSSAVGMWAGSWRGLIIGMMAAPAASTAAYNIVKAATKNDDEPAKVYISASFAF